MLTPWHHIWDRVGFYTIHTFLDPLVECQVKSFLSLIIYFWNNYNMIFYFLSHYHLLPQPGTLHLTSRAAWGWPTGLGHNFEISLSKNDPQAQQWPSSFGDRYCLSFKSRKVLVARVFVGCFKSKKCCSTFSYKKTGNITWDKLRTRTSFQWFLTIPVVSPGTT